MQTQNSHLTTHSWSVLGNAEGAIYRRVRMAKRWATPKEQLCVRGQHLEAKLRGLFSQSGFSSL